MPRKKTTEEFIIDARKVHGDKYNYSLVDYQGNKAKVKIICKKHGVFTPLPYNHVHSGSGCPKCANNIPSTSNRFVSKATKKHGNKYTYDLVEYKSSRDKVTLRCKKHGIFKQSAYYHLQGGGCKECYREKRTSNTETFIKKATEKHGNKYDYSLVKYRGVRDCVTIICMEHGNFEQMPASHLGGSGCTQCCSTGLKDKSWFIKSSTEVHAGKYDYSLVEYKGMKRSVKIICKEHGVFIQRAGVHLRGFGCTMCSGLTKKTNKEFIKQAKTIHGNKFGYQKVEYYNSKTNVVIICKKHGEFKQSPQHHLTGGGCPKCKNSLGENKILSSLTSLGLIYETQKRFVGCKDKRQLPFDFYIPLLNILIEYDGLQHFRSRPAWGGEIALKQTQRRDAIKTTFAEKHGYKLLRIKYTDYDRIEDILREHLTPQGNVVRMPQPQQLALAI
jgi:hypothetical protein